MLNLGAHGQRSVPSESRPSTLRPQRDRSSAPGSTDRVSRDPSDRLLSRHALEMARRVVNDDCGSLQMSKLQDLTENAPGDCKEAETLLQRFADPSELEDGIAVYHAEDQPAGAAKGTFLSFAAKSWDSARNNASRACGTTNLGTPVRRHRALHNSTSLLPDGATKPETYSLGNKAAGFLPTEARRHGETHDWARKPRTNRVRHVLATHSVTPTPEGQGQTEESTVTVRFERSAGVDRAILTTADATLPDESMLSRVSSAPGLSAWSEDAGAASSVAVGAVAPRLLNLRTLSVFPGNHSSSVSVSGQQLRMTHARVALHSPTSLREGHEKSATGEVASTSVGSRSLNEGDSRAGSLRQGVGGAVEASSSARTRSLDGRTDPPEFLAFRSAQTHHESGFKAQTAPGGGDLTSLSCLLKNFHLPPPPPSRGGTFNYLNVVVPQAGSPEPDARQVGDGGMGGVGRRRGQHAAQDPSPGAVDQLLPLREDESDAAKEQASLLLYAARGCTPAAMASRPRWPGPGTGTGPLQCGARAPHNSGDDWGTGRLDSGKETTTACGLGQQPPPSKNFYPYPRERAVQDKEASPTSSSSLRRAPALVSESSGGGARVGVGVGGRGGGGVEGGGGEHALTARVSEGASPPSTFGMISAFNCRRREQQEAVQEALLHAAGKRPAAQRKGLVSPLLLAPAPAPEVFVSVTQQACRLPSKLDEGGAAASDPGFGKSSPSQASFWYTSPARYLVLKDLAKPIPSSGEGGELRVEVVLLEGFGEGVADEVCMRSAGFPPVFPCLAQTSLIRQWTPLVANAPTPPNHAFTSA